MSHWVRGHFRSGRWVRGHWRRSPGGRSGSAEFNNHDPIGSGIFVVAAIVVIGVAVISFGGVKLLSRNAGNSGHSSWPVNPLAMEARAGFKRAEAALKAKNFDTGISVKFDMDCAGHSEGQVQTFLKLNPCKRMARAFIHVGEIDRDLILVAISWLEMPDVGSAEEYKRLIDADAGKLVELSREVERYRKFTYKNRTYVTGIKGSFVWNAEVTAQFSATSDLKINEIVDSVRQQ